MELITKLNPSDLKPGMILAKDIIINGIKLLNGGIEITPVLIEKLKTNYPLNYIYIYDENNPENKKLFENRNSVRLKKSQKKFKVLSTATENIFKKTKENDLIDMIDVRNICDSMLKELNDSGPVIKNIIEGQQIDEYLFRHSLNVSSLSALIGKWLKLDNQDIILLSYSGMLHDIGKCKIPSKILNKPGAFLPEERAICNTHAQYSYELVKKIPFLDKSVALAVLLHHEREDGSGYPLGIKSDKIPLFAKIVAIADIFDAMTSNRVYRGKLCPLDVLDSIKYEIFGKLDPAIASLFINNILNYYIGEIVQLNTGELGKIIKIDINNIPNPWIEMNGKLIDLAKEKNLIIRDIL
ncbi:HD-GYP domain, c-di-GMP phosphodiesterase class II (or its inactivated variant) [Clostridium cavendishii DSM 21758]|uniref:HD-GYP domain, c-di-GMP phosphodiesterase class II (Or its inactivated variant) n=1 Tax=Clostridium cavendishii DSM 21758 TaxID=1121302 RepID=A0A1M6PAA9_9CLOT|nr:HD-GYP domain-containing protein [Clostridium cavendishii]SHK04867.1 HD-GYP domain, c-di-GMP phosphodiesterase class II (or its inactivated variant) [Clostridium cavendishii DSM 21758]